jgi:hypothetical protein
MVQQSDKDPHLQGIKDEAGYIIPVAWKKADALQARLQARGIPATVIMEPLEKEARLEVPPTVDPRAVEALLAEGQV